MPRRLWENAGMGKTILAGVLGLCVGIGVGAAGSQLLMRPAPVVPPTVSCPPAEQPALGKHAVKEDAEAPPAPPAGQQASDARLNKAQDEYVKGNYAHAIELARQEVSSSPTRAWRIIGSSACNAEQPELASEAHQHLDSASKQYLVYVCGRQNFVFEGDRFKRK